MSESCKPPCNSWSVLRINRANACYDLFETKCIYFYLHSTVSSISHALIHDAAWSRKPLRYVVTWDRPKESDVSKTSEMTLDSSCPWVLRRIWRIEMAKSLVSISASVVRWLEVNRYSILSGYCKTVKPVTVFPPFSLSHNWASLLTKHWNVCSADWVVSNGESRALAGFLVHAVLRTWRRIVAS